MQKSYHLKRYSSLGRGILSIQRFFLARKLFTAGFWCTTLLMFLQKSKNKNIHNSKINRILKINKLKFFGFFFLFLNENTLTIKPRYAKIKFPGV
jgi:hypothetical protein